MQASMQASMINRNLYRKK